MTTEQFKAWMKARGWDFNEAGARLGMTPRMMRYYCEPHPVTGESRVTRTVELATRELTRQARRGTRG